MTKLLPTSQGARFLLPMPSLLATAWLAVVFTSTRAELADPVAIHFTTAGAPDNSAQRDVFFWVLLNLGVLASLVAVLAAWRGRGRLIVSSWSAGASYLAALAAAIGTWTALTQRGVADWHAATAPSGLALFAVVGAPLAVAVGVLWLGRNLPLAPQGAAPGPTPSLGLGPEESGVFHHRESAPSVVLVTLAAAVALAVSAWAANGWGWLLLSALMVVVGLTMNGYTVTAGVEGLVVRWGVFGWPRQVIALDRIASAHPVTIKPMEWGGWGYRGSLRLFGKAAAVLRRGPGLRLDLRNGTLFALTLGDAETAAGLLNDLIARSGEPRTAAEH